MKDIFLSHIGRTDVVEKFKFIRGLMNIDDPLIFEIGAHYGEDTIRFKKTFPDAKIYCFEPDSRNIAVFKKYIDLEGVELFELAISDKNNDKVDFYCSFEEKADYSLDHQKYYWIDRSLYEELKLSASGSSSLKHNPKRSQWKSLVQTKRLDDFCEEISIGISESNMIDLMWIDVQGAESEVINGGMSAIKFSKFVFIEYGELEYAGALSKFQTIEIFNSMGFSLIRQDLGVTGDLVFKNARY